MKTYTSEEVDDAIRIAKLWRGGKMIGGDEDDVRNILLWEIERLRAFATSPDSPKT